ncbi:MAG: imelysin family protein [Myxococcales bacterium]|nr:imelysin family protein [Polyangiaceae bacterium]MDW8249206.1 imelysin family protein [Myxococcales bacterium]
MSQDRGEVLASFVDRVALPMMKALRTEAEDLAGALEAFATKPSGEALSAARARWSSARGAFRRTDAFGIGPADDIAVTGGILDEPTDLAKLTALAATSPPPDLPRVQSSPASTRGFLAIEALLFEVGTADEVLLARFTDPTEGPGRCALTAALGADLRGKLTAVADAWTAGNFGEQLRTAGKGSTTFRAQRDAFDLLLNRTLFVADRMLNIARKSSGLTKNDPATPTTDRSDRTLSDLADDLTGIEAVYTGVWEGQGGPSIGAIVAEENKGADQAMRVAITGARAALEAFAPPLREAVAARAAEVDALLQGMRPVRRTLATEVFNALGISVGISDKDGD